jgi:hypothetical protein
MRRRIVCSAMAGAALVLAGPATASQLIDRDASDIHLKVDTRGRALVEYRAEGRERHVLVFGAINARAPDPGPGPLRPQARFKVDYSGGWGTYGKVIWPGFRNACRPYDGPPLPWLVTACKAPDGSYWAIQDWQADLPDLGFVPWTASQRRWHLQLSHWSGPPARLEVYQDWIHGGQIHNLFGRVTYRGRPVHGYGTTRHGAPTDGYGRLVYIDTYDSAYGRGWRRENAITTHRPNGNFCYAFFNRNPSVGGNVHPPGYRGGLRPRGNGTAYRVTALGPGVTPDLLWKAKALPAYDRGDPALASLETEMVALNAALAGGDRSCRGLQ